MVSFGGFDFGCRSAHDKNEHKVRQSELVIDLRPGAKIRAKLLLSCGAVRRMHGHIPESARIRMTKLHTGRRNCIAPCCCLDAPHINRTMMEMLAESGQPVPPARRQKFCCLPKLKNHDVVAKSQNTELMPNLFRENEKKTYQKYLTMRRVFLNCQT